MNRRLRWLSVAIAASATASVVGLIGLCTPASPSATLHRSWQRAVPSASPRVTVDEGATRLLRTPADLPAHLECEQARLVARQIHQNLVQPPRHVDPRAFSMSVSDWLDPHGLWSAAPDAPFSPALKDVTAPLLSSFEHPDRQDGCDAARQLGEVLSRWVDELRTDYDRTYEASSRSALQDPAGLWTAISEPAFEDGPVTRPSRSLAEALATRMALIANGLGAEGPRVASAFRSRLFPRFGAAQWGEVVLAAALRAFVLHVDPHGAWAPLDEETSLYEVELEASGRSRMWSQMHRTVAGLRVDGATAAPLQPGDVIVSIGGIVTSGLTVEQAEQLGVLDPGDPEPLREVRVLRQGGQSPITLRVEPEAALVTTESAPSVQVDHVSYRDGEVLVLSIADVPDDLGEEVAAAIEGARGDKAPVGVLLDLRGNGGGSIDGAKAALGQFLPGAPLFPMLRRDHTVELEVAPIPPVESRWKGPVAMLVDGDTASAAEMIAGALLVYQRGSLIGSRTFGKGCAQEYIDDQAGVGVIRLTTLLYALPDGSPVQRVGLVPSLRLESDTGGEREDELENAFPTWRGPDVRRRAMVGPVPWPSHAGRIGHCQDPAICQALRLLGAARPAVARTRRP